MKEHDISRGGGGGDGTTWENPVDKVVIQPNTVRVKFHYTFSFCNNEHKLYLLLHCCKIVIQLSTFIQSNIYIRDWNLPYGLKRASGSHSAILGPVRTYLFLYENGDLFSPFWPTVLLSGQRKRIFSKTLSRVEIFENAVLPQSWGWVKHEEVFENDYVTGSDTSKCPCPNKRWYRFRSLLCFCVKGQKRSKNAACGRRFFENVMQER